MLESYYLHTSEVWTKQTQSQKHWKWDHMTAHAVRTSEFSLFECMRLTGVRITHWAIFNIFIRIFKLFLHAPHTRYRVDTFLNWRDEWFRLSFGPHRLGTASRYVTQWFWRKLKMFRYEYFSLLLLWPNENNWTRRARPRVCVCVAQLKINRNVCFYARISAQNI